MSQYQKSTTTPYSLKRLDAPAEFKFSGDAGEFTGYASIFGNLDAGGDVVLPNAFRESVKTRDGKTLVLFQHRSDSPIGKADVKQDQRGLHVRGELMLDDPTARKAYGLMRGGLLDGMSIGYDVLPGGEAFKNGRRELSALKLFEISVVTFGMNDLARVETVKSANACTDIRELRDLLRSQLSMNERIAKKAAGALWPIINGRDDDFDNDDAVQFALQMATFSNSLRGK